MSSPETTDKSADEAIGWVLKLRAESCSKEDKLIFANWLSQKPEHHALYARYESKWQALDRFKGLDSKLRSEALSYRPARNRSRRWTGWALAASVLLASGLTAFSPEGWYGSHASYATPLGGHETIALSDGSRLELNSDSEVKVHFNRWHRSVELLKGEAFFSVTHQPEREFAVQAANGRIVDIGTEFEVYMQKDKVLVAVQEGLVRIEAKESRELDASQALYYDRKGEFISASADSLENITAWRRGLLIFDHRRLDEVLMELSRYHNKSIRLESPTLGKLKVSGSFKIDRLDSALENIASTLPVTLSHPSADEVVLSSR